MLMKYGKANPTIKRNIVDTKYSMDTTNSNGKGLPQMTGQHNTLDPSSAMDNRSKSVDPFKRKMNKGQYGQSPMQQNRNGKLLVGAGNQPEINDMLNSYEQIKRVNDHLLNS